MNGHEIVEVKATVQGEVEVGRLYITSKGVALQLVGVSPLLIAKLQSSGTLPDVPTRKIMLDFGTDEGEDSDNYQLEELSEGDLQDDEERKRWAEYIKDRDAVLAKRNEKFLKAVFSKGVIVDMSRIEAWKEEMAYFEIEIPTHPLDLKVEYIQTEALSNTQDMVEIITGVLGESGIPEEDLVEVRAMFQRSARRDTPAETIDAQGEVDMGQDLHGDGSSPLLERVASDRLLQGE